ncbi:hypothetical protein [Methanogenium cariaci]|uniref:hypothetical protein n=1 Tax=Methanogenium cariaci TaxID=2197 RepID=UPI00155DC9F4|nr:hypothetical protein [Methanogenium cariaci]
MTTDALLDDVIIGEHTISVRLAGYGGMSSRPSPLPKTIPLRCRLLSPPLRQTAGGRAMMTWRRPDTPEKS